MPFPDEVVTDVTRRLRRVEGQIRGVQGMLAEGRECRDVVAQLSAATRALEQAGLRLVSAGLTYCLEHPEEAAAAGYGPAEMERMVMRLT